MADEKTLKDRISRLGVPPPLPGRKVMGVELPPEEPPSEPTRPEVPIAKRASPPPFKAVHPQRRATETGLAPPAPRSAPMPHEAEVTPVSGHDVALRAPVAQPVPREPERQPQRQPEPPKSLSPNPESVAARVTIGGTELPVKKRHLRALWVWVAPVLVTLATSVFGYVKGYAKGLLDGHDEIVRMREEQRRQHDALVKLESRADGLDGELAKEEQSSRAERATALRKLDGFAVDLEAVKRGLPTIQGLPKKP